MKSRTFFKLLISSILVVLIFGVGLHAALAAACDANRFCNPIKSESFGELVEVLARWVVAIAVPVAAIFIIYSGFLFVTAGGNQQKLEQAKTTFYWTIIGTVVTVGAWALATAIVNFAKGL